MTVPLKALTDFFREVGADQVEHTEKTYLAHAIGVYNDLKAWGCEEELARVGIAGRPFCIRAAGAELGKLPTAQ